MDRFKASKSSSSTNNNSLNQFVEDLSNTKSTCNKRPSTPYRHDNKKSKNGNMEIKSKFQLLPVPKPKLIESKNQDSHLTSTNDKMMKYGRDLRLITGIVAFILNIRKMYPNLYALFEVYGNVLKITKGKHRFQYQILIRNNCGPVLQLIFFEFHNQMNILVGQSVCCTGRFIGITNQFQVFKIKSLLRMPSEEIFCRMENVCKFTLKKLNLLENSSK